MDLSIPSSNPRYIVSTERLVLRPLQLTDTAGLTATVYGDERVSSFLPESALDPQERARLAIIRYNDYWTTSGFGPWAITRHGDGAFIGRGGLKPFPETQDVELIYALGVANWGHGFAQEVARASVRFAFETLGVERVVAYTTPENLRSQRVLLATGFQFLELSDTQYYDRPHSLHAIEREKWVRSEDAYEVFVEG